MRQIALDTETTGINTSDGHRIIEIGCIEMENRRITGKEFHCYINPEREIDEGATRVHGLTYEKLKNEPLFKDIKSDFMNFISDSELIIHNADFDIGFLNYELSLVKSSNVIEDKALVLDTLKMARNMHPGKKNSLDALCNRYEIDRSMRQVHGALIDADLLAKVYLAMTGGQETFELNEAKSHDKEEKIKIQRENSFSLKVIKANSSELDAHENFLSELRDKGECIWNHEAD
ncbi:MAG: DNA polymerase III subunit epsilon [Woeseiaceae bacterium]|tara:strand:- start:4370 stop:5068 length:699 start_codon:yes stop_codon:yes gene_type:complete